MNMLVWRLATWVDADSGTAGPTGSGGGDLRSKVPASGTGGHRGDTDCCSEVSGVSILSRAETTWRKLLSVLSEAVHGSQCGVPVPLLPSTGMGCHQISIGDIRNDKPLPRSRIELHRKGV